MVQLQSLALTKRVESTSRSSSSWTLQTSPFEKIKIKLNKNYFHLNYILVNGCNYRLSDRGRAV